MSEDNSKNQLSPDDIKSLMENPNTETKVLVIEKLARQYSTHNFTDSQIQLAEQIFRLLIKQAEVEVRKALSENVMSCKTIPHDVVFELAKDIEEVSLPVLEFSDVLTDSDLVEVIKSTNATTKHIAIANRDGISEDVSSALVETNNEDVIENLLDNESAQISKKSYDNILESFSNNEIIADSMISRGSLPQKTVESMMSKISRVIQKKLEGKYKHSFEDINDFFKESSEVATFKFMSKQSIDQQVMDLIDDLEKTGKLNEALHPVHGMLTHLLDGLDQLGQLAPLSALAQGNDTLFEITISRLTSVPFQNVETLCADKKGGLRALYEQAQLPPKFFDAVQLVLAVIKNMKKDAEAKGAPKASEDLSLMIKNIMNASKSVKIPNLAHFISTVNHHMEQSQGEW